MTYTSKLYVNESQVPAETNKYLKLKLAISRSQLIDIVYEVYGRMDTKTSLKPHLLLICEPTTSKNALEVMFKRAKRFIDTYMIIGINNLTFKLQGVSARKLAEFDRSSRRNLALKCLSIISI